MSTAIYAEQDRVPAAIGKSAVAGAVVAVTSAFGSPYVSIWSWLPGVVAFTVALAVCLLATTTLRGRAWSVLWCHLAFFGVMYVALLVPGLASGGSFDIDGAWWALWVVAVPYAYGLLPAVLAAVVLLLWVRRPAQNPRYGR
jgi:hypothetical protein